MYNILHIIWMVRSLRAIVAPTSRPCAQHCGTAPDYARFCSPAPDGRAFFPGRRPPYPAYIMPIAAPGIVLRRLHHPGLQGS